MRTGEIIDLAHERRLSAVLDFTPAGAELLILNGGSRAEEITVHTQARARSKKARRGIYCIDSGTSMLLTLPLLSGESPRDLTVRVVGGHGEMTLSAPPRQRPRFLITARGWSSVAAAMAMLLLAGGNLDSSVPLASADPEPAPVEAPLVNARISLRPPARLPDVETRTALPTRRVAAAPHPVKIAERHVIVAAAPLVAAPRRVDLPTTPAPRMTDLHVPRTATSGDFVPVSFGAIAHQVKIVASIGPTIVLKTVVAASRGIVTIRSPKSDLDSRVMTVRAYAEDGNRTSTLQAMVVLVHP